MELLILIGKCILIGLIWAALLIPIIFNRGGALKYIITVAVITVACFLFRGYSYIINQMTLIALIALVLSWIISMAVFDKESKVKSKIISFTCVIAGLSYFIGTFFASGLQIL